VKDFRVGVGKPDTPTPTGRFTVLDRQFNPPWTAPDGRVLPYGHADNELGDAWISIVNDEYPRGAGYGIHGTNKPDTVGHRSSNGCVRLLNEDAKELVGWVRRQDSNGGAPTPVIIR
jgi:lipoprotein-anchoring transpeptidase ErfK/SrfK